MYKFERLLEILFKKLKTASLENLAVGKNKEFKVLISGILSTRTRDEITEKVSEKLYNVIKNFDDLDKIKVEDLEKLIYPVAFYRTKAIILKRLAKVLKDKEIPTEINKLLILPGVGRKIANLVLTLSFNKEGIAVDTHVHRISNRYEYVDTEFPEQTELILKEKLPKKYWKSINNVLVVFGREICYVKPRCKICSKEIKEICPYFKKLNYLSEVLKKFKFSKITKLKEEKGIYILKIRLDKGRKIKNWFFRKGYYFYVGSAFGNSINLKTRISRHLSKNKKRRWHIDYLLDYGKIKEIWISNKNVEHDIAKMLGKKLDYIENFGSSDCSCKSHLFFMKF